MSVQMYHHIYVYDITLFNKIFDSIVKFSTVRMALMHMKLFKTHKTQAKHKQEISATTKTKFQYL